MDTVAYLTILCLTVGSGHGKVPVAHLQGTYKAQISQEVKNVVKKMGMPEPEAQFIFNTDNTFTYSSNSGAVKQFSGIYEIEDHIVKLKSQASSWLSNTMMAKFADDKELEIDGITYKKSVFDAASFAGTYLVKTSGLPDATTKMEFKSNGTFAFTSHGATSKGTFKIDGNSLTLLWTEIDGEKVTDGSIHKSFPINDDGTFQIDSYCWMKS